jgi:GPH family glycoside/pentoside/hexuronide:cation symporter
MTSVPAASDRSLLGRYAVFGAALAFAGPPIYIHTPALYGENHAMSLAAVGSVLLGLRMLDFIQDPLLGWFIARTRIAQRWLSAGFGLLLAIGALLLFAPQPLFDARWWLALSLVLVFTGFSALQIMFYSAGIGIAATRSISHPAIAGWREAGILIGVSFACVAPALLANVAGATWAYTVFALLFCVLLAVAAWRMFRFWPTSLNADAAPSAVPGGFWSLLADTSIRRLLIIGLLNALPTGITATLFLFFVQDRLGAPEHTGPALLLFFLAAAAAAPLWARIAVRIGAKPAMLAGMLLSIAVFAVALTLGAGDWAAFYLISAVSGAAVGADMTLLPAMLSRRLAEAGHSPSHAFGLWGFVNKFSLALAAGLALPALDAAGFVPGAQNQPEALLALSLAYAGVPSALKAIAAFILLITPIQERTP